MVDRLFDAASHEEFDELLENIKDIWNEREYPFVCQGGHPQFFIWFKNYKAPEIRECALSVVCTANGLGNPPIQFTTNDNEAANSVIKEKVRHAKNSLPDFIDKMEELVMEQANRVHEAIVGDGDFQFTGDFKQFHLASKWWTLTENQ